MTAGGRCRCSLTSRPRSVPPASSMASGCPARSASNSASVAGRWKTWPSAAKVALRGGRQRRRGGAVVLHPGKSLDDRAVAGAAAEVARQRLVHRTPFARMRPGGHGDARGAEAALGGIALGQQVLHRMRRAVGAAQAFHRAHRHAMQLAEHRQAGIDRRAMAVRLFQHHGAGAAIALGAAFLGAGERRGAAQPVQQRHGGRGAGRQGHRRAVQHEHDAIGHAGRLASAAPAWDE